MLKKYKNQPLATNPATIEVPKNTNIKIRITRISIAKNLIQRDLYIFGPEYDKKFT